MSCREIEDRALEFDGIILECAVIGAANDVVGEAVRAFVITRSREHNGVRGQLQVFCKTHLAPNLVPPETVLLPALQKNSADKVL